MAILTDIDIDLIRWVRPARLVSICIWQPGNVPQQSTMPHTPLSNVDWLSSQQQYRIMELRHLAWNKGGFPPASTSRRSPRHCWYRSRASWSFNPLSSYYERYMENEALPLGLYSSFTFVLSIVLHFKNVIGINTNKREHLKSRCFISDHFCQMKHHFYLSSVHSVMYFRVIGRQDRTFGGIWL